MNKKPLLHGLLASAYIFLLVTIMTFGSQFAKGPDTFLMPVLFISIFTFSAAIMAFLFCLEPLMLFLEGKRKQAIQFFLQTTGVFGTITLIILILVFSGIFKP